MYVVEVLLLGRPIKHLHNIRSLGPNRPSHKDRYVAVLSGRTLHIKSVSLSIPSCAQDIPIGVLNRLVRQLEFLESDGPENFLSDRDKMNDENEEI